MSSILDASFTLDDISVARFSSPAEGVLTSQWSDAADEAADAPQALELAPPALA